MLFKLILILPIIVVSAIEVGDLFPKSAVPQVFQVKIQSTEAKINLTTLGIEYHDGVNERGSFITWSEDQKSQITYKRRQDKKFEYFTVIDDVTCKDVRVDNETASMLVDGNYALTTSYYFSFLTLSKLKAKNQLYMGINAATFAAVIRFGDEDANIEFMWSIPESNWQFPNCPKDCSNWWVPLKTTVWMAQPNSTIKLTYVYYDYKNTIDDPEAFQLPRGVACDLLESTRPFPNNLPVHFEAGVETFFPLSELQISAKERIYYNMDHDMVRVDIDLPEGMINPENPRLDREIWDYTHGVVYKMNTKNGTCNVETMTSAELALKMKKKSSIGILNSILSVDADPNSLFYVGVRTYRSMKCDVWIINQTDTPTEIYMVNETANNEDGLPVSYSVPVFLNTSSSMDGLEIGSSAMSFFNYEIKVPSWDLFDTTSCFIEDLKLRFQIELKGVYIGVIDQNPNSFIFQIQKQLASQTKVLPNRFQEILIDAFESPDKTSTILFTTTLVENPYNAGHVGSSVGDKTNNQQVYAGLADAIFNSKLKFTFTYAEKPYSYDVVSIRDDVVSIPVTSLKDQITATFQQLGKAVITKGIDFQTTKISRMKCFELCVNSVEFECKSWSYCSDKGDCILSSHLVEQVKEEEEFEYKENTNCEFYTRYFLKDYVINRETATEATDVEIGVELKADTEADCAKHCSLGKTPFYCEGFDSCTDTSEKVTCYFRTRHILEMAPTTIKKNTSCTHYTRDYLGDYLHFKNKSADSSDFDMSVVTAESVKDCARMCTTSAHVDACKAFEMCSPDGVVDKPRTLCRILDSSKKGSRQLHPDATCDHYMRNHFISDRNKPLHPDDRKPTGSPSPPAALKSAASYSGGTMFALAIGMILLGLLIGCGVMVGLMKYKVMQR